MCRLKLKLSEIEELMLVTQMKDPKTDLCQEVLLKNALKKLRKALKRKEKRSKRKYRGKMKIEEKKDYSSLPKEKIDTEDLLGLNNFTDLKSTGSSDTEEGK